MGTELWGGSRFLITIAPPIALPAEDDDATVIAVATEINAEIERWIRAAPDQWFWPHRRWGKDLPYS